MKRAISVVVYGPAYLDAVLRVDGPLLDRRTHPRPLDRGILGRLGGESGERDLRLLAPDGSLRIRVPSPGHGLGGDLIGLADPLGGGTPFGDRALTAAVPEADLGGMGAGYAKAFDGVLISALGDPEVDPVSRQVTGLLRSHGIRARPIVVPGRAADWTLLATSGAHGDKLAVGFRGCHASLEDWGPAADCMLGADLVVAASLTNALARAALGAADGPARMFAPTRFNMLDRDPPVASFAKAIDILCCNQQEWELLPLGEREEIARRVALLSVTDGPAGCRVACGGLVVEGPAFPRAAPPRDTNRAGESFAATLVQALMRSGWRPGAPLPRAGLRAAVLRASAAAALVLDIEPFGFPEEAAVDAALRGGIVGG
jgi:sugar/nucleoside kinase (ribokinase family)